MSDRDDSCPIREVHARLDDAHLLWHEAVNAYHSPREFRTFLNSCIQTMRNVTFVLQKSKTAIPGFDTWYAGWQEKMREDAVMRWLVEARNRVVKEGDLETKSLARLSIVDSYEAPAVLVLDVDPFVPLPELGRLALAEDLPEHTRAHGSARVERRWVAEGLGEHELLDGLAHGFGVLASLIADGHLQIGYSKADAAKCTGGVPIRSEHLSAEHLGGRPPCMVATESAKSIWIELASGVPFRLASDRFTAGELDEEAIQEHYGPIERVPSTPPNSLQEWADHFFSMAERVLTRDGFHGPIAILILPDGSIMPVGLRMPDRSAKYVVFEELATHVRRTGAEAIVVIGEAWKAPFDPAYPERHAVDSPDRIEVLGIDACSKVGEDIGWCRAFTRAGDDIILGERLNFGGAGRRYLDAVLRVWQDE